MEPIARAQIGGLSLERVWGDMMRDMPQGLPAAGDEGLDNTHTRGRTYWGGKTLERLYRETAAKPVPVDLASLWVQLVAR